MEWGQRILVGLSIYATTTNNVRLLGNFSCSKGVPTFCSTCLPSSLRCSALAICVCVCALVFNVHEAAMYNGYWPIYLGCETRAPLQLPRCEWCEWFSPVKPPDLADAGPHTHITGINASNAKLILIYSQAHTQCPSHPFSMSEIHNLHCSAFVYVSQILNYGGWNLVSLKSACSRTERREENGIQEKRRRDKTLCCAYSRESYSWMYKREHVHTSCIHVTSRELWAYKLQIYSRERRILLAACNQTWPILCQRRQASFLQHSFRSCSDKLLSVCNSGWHRTNCSDDKMATSLEINCETTTTTASKATSKAVAE